MGVALLLFNLSRPRRLIELSNLTHTASRTSAENTRSLHGSPRTFFSLCCERILDGSDATDPFIDLDKGPLQLPIAAKGLNFPFGFALLSRRGEAFGDRFAIHLISQPRMWTVARIIGKVAMTIRTTTRPPVPVIDPARKSSSSEICRRKAARCRSRSASESDLSSSLPERYTYAR
jgi:hypothetical protein